MEKTKKGFYLKDIHDLATATKEQGSFIPDSDLALQVGDKLLQYEYNQTEEVKKTIITPGIHTITPTNSGLVTIKTEFRTRDLLTDITSTSAILKEADTFFNKLDIYEKLGKLKKRGVLLYSAPGLGKTSAICKFCLDMEAKDAGTVVLVWPTDQVRSSDMAPFLGQYSEFSKECTKLILVIEDIGGGEQETARDRSASSGLLNLLDGVSVTFRLPTFIIATTNHPANLLGSLANRPGRFDLMLELKPPSHQERIRLLEFIAKRETTEEEKAALGLKDVEGFSIAHLEEIVIRSMIHDKTIPEVIKELSDHYKKFKKNFEDGGKLGFGG